MRGGCLAVFLVATGGCLEAPPSGSPASGDGGGADGAAPLECDGGQIASFADDFDNFARWEVVEEDSCTITLVDGDIVIENTGTSTCRATTLNAFDAREQTVWLTLDDENLNTGDPDLHFRLLGPGGTLVDLHLVSGMFEFRSCVAPGECTPGAALAGTGRYLAIHVSTSEGQVWADVADEPVFAADATVEDPGLGNACLSIEFGSDFNPGGPDEPILVEGVNQP